MSNFTPPGWYPDPEPAAGADGTRERFWDGAVWTARTRPLPPSGGPSAAAPDRGWDGGAPLPATLPLAATPPLAAAPPPPAALPLATPPRPAAAPQPASQPSARPAVAGPAEPPSSLSDASPAYGHPAIPEPAEGLGYGYPAPVQAPAHAYAQSPVPPPMPSGPAAVPPPYGYQPPGYPAPPAPRKRTGLIVGVLAGALTLVVLTAGLSITLFRGSGRGAPASAAVPPVAGRGPLPTNTGGTGGRLTGPATEPVDPPSAGAGALPPGAASPGTTAPGTASPDASPAAPGAGLVPDAAHNWSVPLPEGWAVAQHDAATTLLLVTGPYQCATPGGCVRGNFEIDSRTASGPDAATVARRTMSDYAPQLFGRLTSHQELASGPVTVAGQNGFAVRWHVVPEQAGPGYLLLIALPAPGGGFTTIVGSVDDDPQAPGPAALDQIATGIQAATAPIAT